MRYRWLITADLICNEAVGVRGPSSTGADENITANPADFVMKDGDGETCYRGRIWGDYSGFEPLDDYGEPNAGCCRIFYDGVEL